MTFTRIPRSFKSVVQLRAKERTEAFVAEYTLKAGMPLLPATDALRMIDPPLGISGNAFCTVNKTPLTLVLKICS
jgi:hypothetical protein